MRNSAEMPSPAQIFESDLRVGDQTIHFVRCGSGSTLIILLHGWPQSSHEWRHVMPLLGKRFTVIAPDLRGIGGTSVPPGAFESGAFDKASLAKDVHALVQALKLESDFERVIVAGHDIGGMVAYAYARLYSAEIAGAVIMDIPIPGLEPWYEIKASPMTWHFDFHTPAGLAETLVQGHQARYFSTFFFDGLAARPEAISAADVAAYAAAYGSDQNLRAMCELYRAFPKDEQFFSSQIETLDVPLLLIGGENTFAGILPKMAKALAEAGAKNVQTAVIEGSGHWMSEEQPAWTAAVISDFATQSHV